MFRPKQTAFSRPRRQPGSCSATVTYRHRGLQAVMSKGRGLWMVDRSPKLDFEIRLRINSREEVRGRQDFGGPRLQASRGQGFPLVVHNLCARLAPSDSERLSVKAAAPGPGPRPIHLSEPSLDMYHFCSFCMAQ